MSVATSANVIKTLKNQFACPMKPQIFWKAILHLKFAPARIPAEESLLRRIAVGERKWRFYIASGVTKGARVQIYILSNLQGAYNLRFRLSSERAPERGHD